jgi:hypothetical protein
MADKDAIVRPLARAEPPVPAGSEDPAAVEQPGRDLGVRVVDCWWTSLEFWVRLGFSLTLLIGFGTGVVLHGQEMLTPGQPLSGDVGHFLWFTLLDGVMFSLLGGILFVALLVLWMTMAIEGTPDMWRTRGAITRLLRAEQEQQALSPAPPSEPIAELMAEPGGNQEHVRTPQDTDR